MSNRERVIQLMEDIPDDKLMFVIDIVESLRAYAGESIQPDEFDLQMIEDATKQNDGETISIDDLSREMGIVL